MVPHHALEGLCPRCLGAMNLAGETAFTDEEARRLPPLSPEEIAPHFPQLEILECLGRGGMGVVYKARQKALNRLVALKLLAPEREKDAHFAERFAREAQALAQLDHPHIVTIHDFGQSGSFFYLLMEFVDGVNLRQLLGARKLTPEEALAIVPPLCEALQFAHERGIVHCDIKPENLLLTKDGRVKIADFGIAKLLGNGAQFADERAAGTPGYMAPEQKETPQRVDSRADIYSLGVVFYEMLTGELPANLLQPPSRRAQIDVRLDEIVLQALHANPEQRFQTAAELRTRVEAVSATASSPQRNSHASQAATAVPQRSLSPATRRSAAPPGSRSSLKWLAWLLALVAVALIGYLLWPRLAAPTASDGRRGTKLHDALQPFGGRPRKLPGHLQVEEYDRGEGAYHDANEQNRGNAFRLDEGVDVGRVEGGDGGFYIGWTQPGESLHYTVEITQAGSYRVEACVAHAGTGGGTFHIELYEGGIARRLAPLFTIPATGGWQVWKAIAGGLCELPAGRQTLRIVFDSPGNLSSCGSVDWISFEPVTKKQE